MSRHIRTITKIERRLPSNLFKKPAGVNFEVLSQKHFSKGIQPSNYLCNNHYSKLYKNLVLSYDSYFFKIETAEICWGDRPQHPPIIWAPSLTQASVRLSNSSGLMILSKPQLGDAHPPESG